MTPEALEAWSIRCSCAAALPPPARKGNDSLRELDFFIDNVRYRNFLVLKKVPVLRFFRSGER